MSRPFVPLALLLGLAASASGGDSPDGLPAGRGVAAPNGSVFTTEITAGDADDFVLTGYAGTQLSAAVRAGRRGSLVPVVDVLRPDGSTVTGADGLAISGPAWAPVARFTLDATGTWKVRVRGKDGSYGAYSVTVKTSKPVRTSASLDAPDANRQFRFRVPAGPGARIGWTLTWTGSAAPSFNSLLDPRGHAVPGVPAATAVKSFAMPSGSPVGDYTLTFDAAAAAGGATLSRTLVPPKGPKARVAKMSRDEPVIFTGSVAPTSGVTGMRIAVRAASLADPFALRGRPGLLLGDTPLEDVALDADGATLRGTIPLGLANGVYDVVATSTSGQPAVAPAAFEVVSRPVVAGFDPPYGPAVGGFEITLTGSGFRPASGLLFDGVLQPVTPTFADATTLRFPAPQHAPGFVSVGVRDLGTGIDVTLAKPQFEYVTTPMIARMTPALVPILSTETVTIEGSYFFPDDKVFLETTTTGVFEEITASQTTYVDFNHHRFAAPLRPKGEYDVYVEDAQGRPSPRRPKPLTYFSLVDATAASGLGTGPDSWDAATSALADIDRDGHADLILSRRGAAAIGTTSATRVLRNDGHGVFTDATASAMPAVADDDWRADRVVAADVDGDGFADLVLTTNSISVPPAGRSHTRILMNEARGGTGTNAAERVFRDRTSDVMAAPRVAYPLYTGAGPYVADDWRGLDLWVGDLDVSKPGTRSIVVTHDETKQEVGVDCGNYCASPYSGGYTYGAYWGGTRKFTWDRTARGGLGRFRFDVSFLPRRSGVQVPSLAPGGISLPLCNAVYGQPCAGRFTPFTGQRLAVGDLDANGRLDVAVVSNQPVQRRFTTNGPMTTISSLQVGINGFNQADGAGVTDVTAKLTALGLDLSGDAVAIGVTGFPDGNGFGTIAVAKPQIGAGSALTLLRFSAPGGVLSLDDATSVELPPATAGDAFQAAEIRFADVDGDGAQDLVLLAPGAPSGGASAFRILRNEEAAGQKGVFRRSFDSVTGPLSSPADRREGDALSIGDVTGDGLAEFVVSRAGATNSGSDTRVLRIDK